ncbi:hypothetical protein [Pseudidiomarina sp.]|uniref:hypothetical protein n=1 Tax=Pseudidiomarina sp. TaxID=2081707 RepID=UPI003A968E0C
MLSSVDGGAVIAFDGAMWRNTTKEVSVTEQYTHAELLFAIEVRDAALKLRHRESPRHLADDSDDVSLAEQADWIASHPIEPYYAQVLDGITKSADIIRGILKP